jgi:hypothetical protein
MKRMFATVGLVVAAGAANAATVFSEDFNSYPLAVPTNGNFGVWSTFTAPTATPPFFMTPSASAVDLIGSATVPVPGVAFDFYPNNGVYVDLDGTGNPAPGFSGIATTITLPSAPSFNLSFSLGNNPFTSPSQVLAVLVPNGNIPGASIISTQVAVNNSPNFATVSQSFTATAGVYQLAFVTNVTGDNGGAVIDNILVTAVPEPGQLAMLFGGLGMIVAMAARRRRNVR